MVSLHPTPGPLKVAIVTMLLNSELVLDSYIRYHQNLGIAHFYLFFDAPTEEEKRIVAQYSNVTAIFRDAALEKRWESTTLFQNEPWHREFCQEELQSRQVMNVEIAIQMCREDGMDWILHIDVDELFYLGGESLQTHFARLERMGLDNLIYPNYEGVSEQMNFADYFKAVSLFKTKPLRFNTTQKSLVGNSRQLRLNRFYNFYDNGKSAGKIGPDLLPHGPHGMATYRYSKSKRKIFLGKLGYYHFQEFRREARNYLGIHSGKHQKAVGEAAILHYACCGFQHFWDKYETLGEFKDTWFGKVEIADHLSFHIESRNVVNRGGYEAAIDFFRHWLLFDDAEETAEFIANGLMKRITLPSDYLNALAAIPHPKPTQKQV